MAIRATHLRSPSKNSGLRYRVFLVFLSLVIWGVCLGQENGRASFLPRTPQEFGATGDGKADDTAAIQQALDSGSRVFLPAGSYRVTRTLRLDSRTTLYGEGRNSIITGDFDGPILASRNYFADEKLAPQGSTVLRDFVIEGSDNRKFVNNHGILLRDFYSSLEHIEVRRVGGFGIFLTELRDDGSRASSGTLVENRIEHVVVRGSWRSSFYLGEKGNKKYTDGYLYSSISQASRNIESHLFIGSAGGWRIEDFHGYGKSMTQVGAEIVGAFRTKIRGMHLQNFGDVGIFLKSTQESVFLEGISLDSDSNSEGAYGIRIGRNADYLPRVQITSFSVTKDKGRNRLTALFVGSDTTVSLPSEIAIQGRESGKVTRYEIKGAINTSPGLSYQLSSSLEGLIEQGIRRKILGVVSQSGKIEDFFISIGDISNPSKNEFTIEASLTKLSSGGEISLLESAAIVNQNAGQGFVSTLSPGSGVRPATIRLDSQNVEKGDLIVADFKLLNSGASEVLIKDAALVLTIQTN